MGLATATLSNTTIPFDNPASLGVLIYRVLGGVETFQEELDAGDSRITISNGDIIVADIATVDDSTMVFTVKVRNINGAISESFSPRITLVVPPLVIPNLNLVQNIQFAENASGNFDLTWDEVNLGSGASEIRVYRAVVNANDGNEVRQLVATLALGTGGADLGAWEDTTTFDGFESEYDIQTSDGTNETNSFTADNFGSITKSQVGGTTLQGLLFDLANNDHVMLDTEVSLTAPWSVKIGAQSVSGELTEAIGLFGSTTTRFLIDISTSQVKANVPGVGSLLTSPVLNNINMTDRKEAEIYCEANGDVYWKNDINATPEFCFSISSGGVVQTPTIETFMTAETSSLQKKASGYNYSYKYTVGGVERYFNLTEGSGTVLTADDGTTTATIMSDQPQPYIDNTMWTADLPLPVGFINHTSYSIGGLTTNQIITHLLADPAIYVTGSREALIAEIYDNYSADNTANNPQHNPAGFDHFVLPIMTNPIGNISAHESNTEYQAHLVTIGRIFNGTYGNDLVTYPNETNASTVGMSPITYTFGTAGSIVTSIKQPQKNYDPTIGVTLSGDVNNPTPESAWDFNVASTGVVAVIPLYVTASVNAQAILNGQLTNCCTHADSFAHFLTQPAPYSLWIGNDGTHYNSTGYEEFSVPYPAQYALLPTAPTNVCVIGDSLGDGITASIMGRVN